MSVFAVQPWSTDWARRIRVLAGQLTGAVLQSAAGTADASEAAVVPVTFGNGAIFWLLAGPADRLGRGGDSTGAHPWWCGLLLAAWLSHQSSSLLRGRFVLELGCGAAPLPTLIAAQQGAAKSVATDGCPSVVQAAEAVLARNSAAGVCLTRCLSWEAPLLREDLGAWDTLLFADAVYVDGAAEKLAATLDALLTTRRCGEILGAVCLPRVGSAELFAAMQRRGFRAEDVELSEEVRTSASAAAKVLSAANVVDLVGLPAAKLVRWIRRGSRATSETERDDGEVLKKEAADALWLLENAVSMTRGWEPEE